jgi:hypothetical protein
VGDKYDNELVGLSGDAFEFFFGRCLVRISSGPPTIVTGFFNSFPQSFRPFAMVVPTSDVTAVVSFHTVTNSVVTVVPFSAV